MSGKQPLLEKKGASKILLSTKEEKTNKTVTPSKKVGDFASRIFKEKSTNNAFKRLSSK